MSILQLGVSVTALGQSSTQDSCICYTESQDIRCLECLINAPKKDAIIIDLKEILKIDSTIIQNHELTVINLRTDNNKKDNKILKLKKNRIFYSIFGAILGFAIAKI